MAKPNHEVDSPMTPAGPSAPSLRLRFDLAPAEGAPELDNVISEVEQLSLGIDTMLKRASSSAVGAITSHAVNAFTNDDAIEHDDDESDVADDEPMMAMFAEEEPSDIHAIDRMLASHAEELVGATVIEPAVMAASAHYVPDEVMVAHEQSEIVLEGEFEDIRDLLGSPESASVIPATRQASPVSSTAASIENATTPVAGALAAGIDAPPPPAITARNPELVVELPQPPPPMLDLSLAPTQAQGIAAALAAASAANGAHRIAEPHPVAIAPSTPPPSLVEHAIAPRTPAVAAQIEPAALQADAPRKPVISSLVQQAVSLAALTNLPLRWLPPGLKPAVNMLALSLALWAPAVMALGPRIAAARQSSHAATVESESAHEAPKHEESGHGDSGGAAKHDAPKSSSSKKKSTSASKKSGSKKSSAAKADDSKAGGH